MTNPTFTLHRYFIWANRMRTHFDSLLPNQTPTATMEPSNVAFIEGMLYMSYWYAGLYVVIEGWTELELHDSVIDGLLSSPNVDLLKRYRNGVFHFQPDYMNARFRGFIEEGSMPVAWIRELNQQFGRFFLEQPHQL